LNLLSPVKPDPLPADDWGPNLLLRYKGVNGAIEDICPTPQFLAAMFREHDPPKKKFAWRGRGERAGQWLTKIRERKKVRWILWYIDFSLPEGSFDGPQPWGRSGTHLQDGVDGEELNERDAARWLDANGYDLPAILMGRTLVDKPEIKPSGLPAAMRREDKIPASGSVTRSTEGRQPTVGQTLDREAREAQVAEFLRHNPSATSGAVHEATGIPPSTVRKSDSWKTHQACRNAEKPAGTKDAMHRAKPLTDARLAAMASKLANPAEIVAEREEQDEPESIEDMKLLTREYLEGATAGERARFHQLNAADKEHELIAWKSTGIRGA
jgi:hypothetical protein